ncbi:thioesterase [Virgisporangium aliadipatigenens]|uniref:Thioesterase n=1 Tax=Virgisporangium aliadipatigenens TaxID=741659 RepID=A0A8J3YRZ9_9ACTN|nr:thioesterase [Virgisporangium aliadipatigenens]GIJ48800.1 thioesterase [Virgisporangium aliadipatigenens]
MNAGRWLPVVPSRAAPLSLFCFPHAGGGAALFRPWTAPLARVGIESCPVQLPGREDRFREEPFRRVDLLVPRVRAVLEPYLDRPYALYGHSMGAIVAFELARALRREGAPPPAHLVVSGRIAPHLVDPRPTLHDLPDDVLLKRLHALGGIPDALRAAPELLAVALPLVRADLELNETYRYVAEPPLPVRLSAYGGADDPKVDATELSAWSSQTAAEFRQRTFPGGHFFTQNAREAMLTMLGLDLAAGLGSVTR